MTCKKRNIAERNHARTTRGLIDGLFDKGYARAGAKHRLAQCLHASECGRVCERLTKGPGKVAYCVDIKTGAKVELYPALEREDFHCPAGRF